MKLTFIEVRAFANQRGYSVEKYSNKGYRIWLTDSQRSRFGDKIIHTLAEVQSYIEAECGEEQQ